MTKFIRPMRAAGDKLDRTSMMMNRLLVAAIDCISRRANRCVPPHLACTDRASKTSQLPLLCCVSVMPNISTEEVLVLQCSY